MTKPDTTRFLADLHELRRIGAFRTGVHRPTYSREDMESRRWLMARMAEVGLEPSIDGVGNVFGRHKGAGPHLLAGSHIESQNEAGWLDGALGVMAALALARAGLPVDVCAFADEEGHFDAGFLGSRSIVGDISEEELDSARNRTDGTPLRDALKAAGLSDKPRMRIDPARYKGYLEMHIEQGTELENADQQVGVVTGIVAIWQWRLLVEGEQDHAGGTTMAERRDAGLTAVRLLAAIDQEFPRLCGPRSTWTTGRITLDPGAPSIIPGTAEVVFQFRDLEVSALERMEAGLVRLVQESNRRERCRTTIAPLRRSGGAGARQMARDAERRRARRAGDRGRDARRHAVHALDRRDQPPLGGGHQGGGPGALHGGVLRGRRAVSRSVAVRWTKNRHARAWPGYPRIERRAEDQECVDGRAKPGHDG